MSSRKIGKGEKMKDILIVGGGASGILVATQIAYVARTPYAVTIADPDSVLGRGLAYGTTDQSHLLNVPAGRMSALPSDAAHFRKWAGCDDGDFISRRRYGQYLLATFLEAQHDATAVSFRHERSKVTQIEKEGDRFVVTTEYGPLGNFDIVVIATGHGAPHELTGTDSIKESHRFIEDPWRDGMSKCDGLLICIGTGLTFIDLALSHLRRNAANRVVGVSRTGELPRPHLAVRAAPLPVPEVARKSPAELRSFIENSQDWRAAQDGVRHEMPQLWFNWSEEEKADFWKRHLRWWNVHRHRMAPEISEELQSFLTGGRLEIVASRILKFETADQRIRVSTESAEFEADLVINSTGYKSFESSELFMSLRDYSLVDEGPLGLGIRSNFPDFEVLGSSGEVIENFYAIGPVLLGERFETTAIPELREQAASIAEHITKSVR